MNFVQLALTLVVRRIDCGPEKTPFSRSSKKVIPNQTNSLIVHTRLDESIRWNCLFIASVRINFYFNTFGCNELNTQRSTVMPLVRQQRIQINWSIVSAAIHSNRWLLCTQHNARVAERGQCVCVHTMDMTYDCVRATLVCCSESTTTIQCFASADLISPTNRSAHQSTCLSLSHNQPNRVYNRFVVNGCII